MPQKISPDIIRTCKLCGQEFHPTSRKQYCCNQMKPRKCVYCGREFLALCSTAETKKTCSKECKIEYAKIARAKSLENSKRICKWCGKEFTPKTAQQVYCNDIHYQTCSVCGKQFEIDVRTDPYVKTCSDECRYKQMVASQDKEAIAANVKKSMLKKYGVENAMQLKSSIEKIKRTNLEKYGSEWYAQTDEYKERVEQTDLEKYGVKHHLQSKEVIDKRVETVQEKYGVNNVFQAEEVKDKIKSANLDKYGSEFVSQSAAIQDKITANNIERYGVKHPMMLVEFQKKAEATNIEKYGRKAYTQQHIKNIEQWYTFINDPKSYIEAHYSEQPRAEQLAEDLGVDQSTVDVYLLRNDARDCVRHARSLMEEAITEFIKFRQPDCTIIHNTRSVIDGYEVDLYLPEYKLAIECDPTCTHNSSCADPWGGKPKSHNYHKAKTDLCEKTGIDLIHIFGYDWSQNKDIVLSMISTKIGSITNKIYARNCTVSEVPFDTAYKFLNENHRQGQSAASIRLGLYYNNELVSLMTFGKPRVTIGNTNDGYELIRFCSLLNTTVVGGASKLFKHFVKEYQPERIISYSDRAHTSGKVYPMLGFKEINRSDANYVWVDVVEDKAYHRMNAQKHNIKQFLKDDSIDLNKSEKEIMEEHGFVRVFDSGTITWEWRSADS